MIRTRDLMQGNLIDKGIVFQICMKDGIQGVYVLKNELSSVSKWYSEKDIEPIELTEEWLKKAGFGIINHIDGYSFWSLIRKRNSDIPSIVIYKNYTVTGNNSRVKHCQHVHQLQNLYFALTGKELKIKK